MWSLKNWILTGKQQTTKEKPNAAFSRKKNCTAKYNFYSLLKPIFSKTLLDISKYRS